MIIMNIICSFVVEIYAALSDEVDLKIERDANTNKLFKAFPDGQGLAELVK